MRNTQPLLTILVLLTMCTTAFAYEATATEKKVLLSVAKIRSDLGRAIWTSDRQIAVMAPENARAKSMGVPDMRGEVFCMEIREHGLSAKGMQINFKTPQATTHSRYYCD